ncbi:MAG: hypothetical protein JW728_00075 [Candidatus Aureabacteria bacterium]|nr:hypothetical protein [Candidatus Auribacterota bacterium]
MAGWTAYSWNTFIGRDGSFAPEPYPFQLKFRILDGKSGKIYDPLRLNTAWSLHKGRFPVNIIRWQAGACAVEETIFAAKHKENGVLNLARVSVTNKDKNSKKLVLVIDIVRNPLLRFKSAGIEKIEPGRKGSLKVNGIECIYVKGAASKFDKGRAVLSCELKLGTGEEKAVYICVPSGEAAAKFSFKGVDFGKKLIEAEKYWNDIVPLKLELPDKRYADLFYSSLYYLLIMMKGKEVCPGPLNYKSFYIHDGVEMVNALDVCGLRDIAEKALNVFNYRIGDGYLDGLGGSIFALFEHFRLDRDIKYLKEIYPRIIKSAGLIKSKRAPQLSPELKNSPLHGLLHTSVSQDNFGTHAHLYLDNWWALVGLRCAVLAAEALKKKKDALWLKKEYAFLEKSINDSLKKVLKREKISYMPAFADFWPAGERKIDHEHRILGDTQMAWAHRPALFPGKSLGIRIPEALFRKSYKKYWKKAGAFSSYDGGWFVEYEKVFWGYNFLLAHPMMYLGMEDVALKNIEWGVKNQSCPGGWMEAMPAKKNKKGEWEIADGIIGDVPHGWSAAFYILLLRNMIIREEADRIVLFSAAPESWFVDGENIEIKDAPTHFGKISLKCEGFMRERFIRLEIDMKTPPSGGFKISIPGNKKIKYVEINGRKVAPAKGRIYSAPPCSKKIIFGF